MNPTERRLLRHVIAAIAIKLIALAALWHFFVQGAQVTVDGARTAVHLGDTGESGVVAVPAPAPGASK